MVTIRQHQGLVFQPLYCLLFVILNQCKYFFVLQSVVDHETWIADISDANRIRANHLSWFKLYSAKEAYGMTSLNPGTWDDLIMSMYKNKQLFNMYYRWDKRMCFLIGRNLQR